MQAGQCMQRFKTFSLSWDRALVVSFYGDSLLESFFIKSTSKRKPSKLLCKLLSLLLCPSRLF